MNVQVLRACNYICNSCNVVTKLVNYRNLAYSLLRLDQNPSKHQCECHDTMKANFLYGSNEFLFNTPYKLHQRVLAHT